MTLEQWTSLRPGMLVGSWDRREVFRLERWDERDQGWVSTIIETGQKFTAIFYSFRTTDKCIIDKILMEQ